MSSTTLTPVAAPFGPLHPELVEVATGAFEDFEGATHEVHGGAYLPPGAVLSTGAEVERLRREREAAAAASAVPLIAIGATLFGFALGYWLGGRRGQRSR
jgi:hypothetical protein